MNLIFLVIIMGMVVLVTQNAFAAPELFDDGLILEKFSGEFGWGYTTMTFVGEDILLLEKSGKVTLIRHSIT